MLEFDAPHLVQNPQPAGGAIGNESRDYGASGKAHHGRGYADDGMPPVHGASSQVHGRRGVPPPAYPGK